MLILNFFCYNFSMIILFDLDGTLIDSTEAILESFHNSFVIHGFKSVNDEEIKALIGHPLDIMYERLGVPKEKVWDFVTSYKERYREISRAKTKLLENAKEAVLLASEFAEIGIVTTKTGKYSKILMEHFELMEYFKVLVGREDVENPKPHEEPILKALKSFDSSDRDIWMIGDTELDLLSAKNASVHSIAVLCGYGKKERLEKFTDLVFNDTYTAIKYLRSRK